VHRYLSLGRLPSVWSPSRAAFVRRASRALLPLASWLTEGIADKESEHRRRRRSRPGRLPARATYEIRNEAYAMIFIGTAGWSVPRGSARHFAGEGSHLQRYARRLNCVEINSSFYRSHAVETYRRWASSVPPTFKFAVKIPRAISHDARLRRARVPLRSFLGEIKGLGTRLGPLLLQLPPSFAFDTKVTRRFCSLLRELHRGHVVIEPRHVSWFSAKATDLLNVYRFSRVAADPAPISEGATAGRTYNALRYYRLHGSPRMYWSNYSRAYLRDLAAVVEGLKPTVWIIFDNTAAGYATANALQFRALVNAT